MDEKEIHLPLLPHRTETNETFYSKCRNSYRYLFAFVGFLGFANVYALRGCLSVAIDPMRQQYNWTSQEEGYILSAFFVGYVTSQILGGLLAEKYGGKWIYGIGLLCTSILTLATPVCADVGVWLLVLLRIVEGVGEGVTYPSMHAMLSKWAPPAERTRISSIVYAGAYFGTLVAFPTSGALVESTFLGGWPAVFYVFGAAGILWFFLWVIFAHSNPREHFLVTPKEMEYIEACVGPANETIPLPWGDLLGNLPFWALLLNHTGSNWGFYTLLTWLPTYLNEILKFNMASTGFVVVLPYLGLYLVSVFGGFFADYLRANYLSTTQVRKIYESIAFTIAGSCLVAMGYSNVQLTSVALMTIAISAIGFTVGGYMPNHLDIAPEFAGVLMGITNTAATIPGIVSPFLTGWILGESRSIERWQLVFWISGAVYAVSLVVWLLFASGEKQGFVVEAVERYRRKKAEIQAYVS